MLGAFNHLYKRILGRAALALLIAVFTVVAICYFVAAGATALDAQYGALYARLIMGAICAALAVAGVIWWAALGRRTSMRAPVLNGQRERQVVMLVEAVMLGYALARKGNRAT